MSWSMFDHSGDRKYLTKEETTIFLQTAERESEETYGLCWIMVATGCRVSEALATRARNIDYRSQYLIIESMKKRERGIYRAVPLPAKLLEWLKRSQMDGIIGSDVLWPLSRMTAYRRIKTIMEKAGISGAFATPKGLRHAFGVRAIQSGAPLNMVQRWLGHADIKTTAIYTNAIGPEERAIVAKTWLESDASYEQSLDLNLDVKSRSARRSGLAAPPQPSVSTLARQRLAQPVPRGL